MVLNGKINSNHLKPTKKSVIKKYYVHETSKRAILNPIYGEYLAIITPYMGSVNEKYIINRLLILFNFYLIFTVNLITLCSQLYKPQRHSQAHRLLCGLGSL